MWIEWRHGAVVAALALAAAGCYESDSPLDAEPLIDLNPAVLGTWRCLPLDADPAEPPVTLIVTRSSRARVYDAVRQEAGDTPDRYDAYASVLRGTTLLNVRERKDSGLLGKWAFLRASLVRPNVLHLQVVAAAAMAGVAKSASAVRDGVERQREAATLYTDVAVCARAKTAK